MLDELLCNFPLVKIQISLHDVFEFFTRRSLHSSSSVMDSYTGYLWPFPSTFTANYERTPSIKTVYSKLNWLQLSILISISIVTGTPLNDLVGTLNRN